MSRLALPFDLQRDRYDINKYISGGKITITVGNDYLRASDWTNLSETLCIQRLVSTANRAREVEVIWDNQVARQVFRSPAIFPLLAIVLCLDDTKHVDMHQQELDVTSARRAIYGYGLNADLFSDVQILLCADNRGHGRPSALYDSDTGRLIAREDFESMIDTLLSTHTGYGVSDSKAVFFVQAIGTIVAELFENTEIHGRLGLDGKPTAKNGLRGIIFKRIKVQHEGGSIKTLDDSAQQLPGSGRKKLIESEALEISVFDSGMGFYSSYTRHPASSDVPLVKEWDTVHRCLERHYDQNDPNLRHSHRAMGLYEVLRALQFVNGILEVRSGRTFGYRTFLPGEFKFQLEPRTSSTRPNMPKPVLLDKTRKFVTVPTEHELLDGAAVRVVIPLL